MYDIAKLRAIQEDANHPDTPNGGLVWDLCAFALKLLEERGMRPVVRDLSIEQAQAAEVQALSARVAELELTLSTVREHEGARIRRELLVELEPEIRLHRIPGSQTVVECIMVADLLAALDRIIPLDD